MAISLSLLVTTSNPTCVGSYLGGTRLYYLDICMFLGMLFHSIPPSFSFGRLRFECCTLPAFFCRQNECVYIYGLRIYIYGRIKFDLYIFIDRRTVIWRFLLLNVVPFCVFSRICLPLSAFYFCYVYIPSAGTNLSMENRSRFYIN